MKYDDGSEDGKFLLAVFFLGVFVFIVGVGVIDTIKILLHAFGCR